MLSCEEFRAKHKPDVKFAELSVAVRHDLFRHYSSCQSCQLFIELLRPEECDTDFDGEALAQSDMKGFVP